MLPYPAVSRPPEDTPAFFQPERILSAYLAGRVCGRQSAVTGLQDKLPGKPVGLNQRSIISRSASPGFLSFKPKAFITAKESRVKEEAYALGILPLSLSPDSCQLDCHSLDIGILVWPPLHAVLHHVFQKLRRHVQTVIEIGKHLTPLPLVKTLFMYFWAIYRSWEKFIPRQTADLLRGINMALALSFNRACAEAGSGGK